MKRQHDPTQPQSPGTRLVGGDNVGWVGAIDQGRRKPDQQDSLAWWTPSNFGYGGFVEGYLFIIADGVGGGTGGAAASFAAAKTIVEEYNSRVAGTKDTDEIADLLTRMIRVANREVFTLSNGSDMATTCACLAMRSNEAVVAWVGDSRIYCLRAKTLEQWTVDHSWAIEHGQRLVNSGLMKPEELATNKNRHQITRALGTAENVEPSVVIKEVFPGDRLLICSDGLWDALPPESIGEQLGRTDLDIKGIAAEMVAQANRRGGRDNISLFIIEASTILATQERLALEAHKDHTVVATHEPPDVTTIPPPDESAIANTPQHAADGERLEGYYTGSAVPSVPMGSLPQEARADIGVPSQPQPAVIPSPATPVGPATDGNIQSWGSSSAGAGAWNGDRVEGAPIPDQSSMRPTLSPGPAPAPKHNTAGDTNIDVSVNRDFTSPNATPSWGAASSQYTGRTGMPGSGGPLSLPDDQKRVGQAAGRNSSNFDNEREYEITEQFQNQPPHIQQQTARPQLQSPDHATRELSRQELEDLQRRQLSIHESNLPEPGSSFANQDTAPRGQKLYDPLRQEYRPAAGAGHQLQAPAANPLIGAPNMSSDYDVTPVASMQAEDDIFSEDYDESQNVKQRKRQRIVQKERARTRPNSQVPMFVTGVGLFTVLLLIGVFVVFQQLQPPQPPLATATPTVLEGSTPTIPSDIALAQTQTAQALSVASMTAAVTITPSVTSTVTPTVILKTSTPTITVAAITPTIATTTTTPTKGPQPTIHPLFTGQQPTPVASELPDVWVACVTRGDCGTYVNHSNDPSYKYENQYWIIGDLYLFWFTDMAGEQENPAYFLNGSRTQEFAQGVGVNGRLLGNPISPVMSFTDFASLTGFADEQALLTNYMKDQQEKHNWQTSSLNVQFFQNGVVACSDIRPPGQNSSLNVGDCDLLNIGTLLVKKYPTLFCPAGKDCDGQPIVAEISQKGQFDDIMGSFQGMTTSRETAVYEKFALTRRPGDPATITLTPLGEWLRDVLLKPRE